MEQQPKFHLPKEILDIIIQKARPTFDEMINEITEIEKLDELIEKLQNKRDFLFKNLIKFNGIKLQRQDVLQNIDTNKYYMIFVISNDEIITREVNKTQKDSRIGYFQVIDYSFDYTHIPINNNLQNDYVVAKRWNEVGKDRKNASHLYSVGDIVNSNFFTNGRHYVNNEVVKITKKRIYFKYHRYNDIAGIGLTNEEYVLFSVFY